METWDEKLEYERVSWYSQSHLDFDVFLAEIKKDSKFTQWFSGSEKQYLGECDKLYISISTSNFGRVITDGMYMSQVGKNNFKEIITPHFLEHVKLHPDYISWNLNMYKPRLLCGGQTADIITIDFPSFETIKIKL